MASKREWVAEIRRQNPCAKLEEIGRHVGLSRERVRQLLKEAGLQAKSLGHREQLTLRCAICGSENMVFPSKATSKNYACSDACRLDIYHPWVACDNCGRLERRTLCSLMRAGRLGHQKLYCSNACKWSSKQMEEVGRANGKAFGFGTRRATHCGRGHELTPENTYVHSRTGERRCRPCHQRYQRERYHRKRGLTA